MNRNNEPSFTTAFKRALLPRIIKKKEKKWIVRDNKARLNAVVNEGSLFLFIVTHATGCTRPE
jgi:hypothetical protein